MFEAASFSGTSVNYLLLGTPSYPRRRVLQYSILFVYILLKQPFQADQHFAPSCYVYLDYIHTYCI